MDIILDLWISAVYNDEQVQGSFSGPVAYFRNGTGCPLVSYSELAQRWGISKTTVGRILKKLNRLNYISLLTFQGRHGTAIYLQNYLSTMFQISDVMVDKDEVAMSLNINIALTDAEDMQQFECSDYVPEKQIIVSKSAMDAMAAKVLQILELQGIWCTQCHRCTYKLYPLSDDCRGDSEQGHQRYRFYMDVLCGDRRMFTFELSTTAVKEVENLKGGCKDV